MILPSHNYLSEMSPSRSWVRFLLKLSFFSFLFFSFLFFSFLFFSFLFFSFLFFSLWIDFLLFLLSLLEILLLISSVGVRPHIPLETPYELVNMIGECWESNYYERPSFDATTVVLRDYLKDLTNKKQISNLII